MALNFNGNTPKKILYNGLNVAKLVYNGVVVWLAKVLTKLTGYPITLTNSVGDDLVDYKVYGESVQDGEPTPDTPIEIESVGDKTSNLFDNDINVSSIVKNGNDLVLKSYACGTGIKPSKFLEMTGLKVGDTFTIKRTFTVEKGTPSTATGAMRFLTSSSGFFKIIDGSQDINTVTITEDFNDTNYTSLYFYGVSTAENGERLVRFSNIQIVKGSYTESTIPEYEPYGYKIPVKVRGKNLFDVEKAKIESNWEGTSYKKFVLFVFKKGVHYTISMSDNLCYKSRYPFNSSTTQVAMVVNSKNAWGGKTIGNSTLTTQTSTKIEIYNETEDTYLVLYHTNTLSKSDVFERLFPNLQIEVGDTATTYEPYVEPISTNIYLKEPLRKIDEYVDYIDFENKKVIRKIYNEFLKTVTSTSSENTIYKKFITNISKKPLIFQKTGTTSGGTVGYAISNKFIKSEVDYNNLGKNPNLIQSYITTSGGNRVANTFDDSSITTVAQANEKLGDGFDVCYVLATPIEEIIELPTIPTHQGTNIIELDTTIKPSNMEVQYYAKGV